MKKLGYYILGLFLISAVFSLISSDDSYALAVDKSCKRVETIFARGSGAPLNEGNGDAVRFFNKISDRLKNTPSLIPNEYELGTDSYGGNRYPAIKVDGWGFTTGLGAVMSAGNLGLYSISVSFGVGELQSYLTQRYSKCKSTGTWYVLGGYSQGAQVIGQALPGINREIRDRIAYVGLFGDPKLYYPEGLGGQWSSACRGGQLSKWRRGTVTNCALLSGSFLARIPYLPTDMEEKVGLWCNAKDVVCDPSLTSGFDSHSEYKSDGRGIDEAAQEATAKLKLIFAEAGNIGQSIDVSLSTGMRTTGRDTVFIIDTTGSMENIIERTKTFVRTSADKIRAGNGRVALVAYRDKGDEYTAKIVSGFNDTYATFQSRLNGLVAKDGGDWPEATLHALTTAMNGLNWRDGATKAAVILTNSSFHNPDTVDGSTIRTVAKRSLEIDPVNVFPVVTQDLAEGYQELAELTSGQVIIDDGDTVEALSTAFDKIQERPVALLKNTEYRAEPGQEITFDASDSYVAGGDIIKYEWDLNGDTIFDITTDTPTFSGTGPIPYSGIIQVRVTADNGLFANASALFTVAEAPEPPQPPAAPTGLIHTVTSTSDNKSTATINWSGVGADEWYISINDIPAGYVAGNRTSLQITDIDRSEDVVISVAGHTAAGGTGEPASTTITRLAVQPPDPEPPIVSTCTQSNLLVQIICKAIALFKIFINGILHYILPWRI